MSQTIQWVAYASSSSRTLLSLPPYVAVRDPGFSWPFCQFKTKQPRPDVFHGTNYKAPDFGQTRTVLTIHDVWLARHPQYSKKRFGQTLSTWKLEYRAQRASRVIAVSNFSAQEIQDVLRLPAERIAVIHHGCSPEMFPNIDEQRFQEVSIRLKLLARPYILFVGGAEPRKNHAVLLQAFARSKRLVQTFSIVAVGNERVRGASMMTTARELGISDFVCCPGLVRTEDLRILYSHACSFVFPSLYEGFGIPLLDAMACGAPIITGRGSALPEVAGDAAIYVDSQDPEQLGVELERLLSDQGLQNQLRRKGFERMTHFSWDRAAKRTLDLYREVYDS